MTAKGFLNMPVAHFATLVAGYIQFANTGRFSADSMSLVTQYGLSMNDLDDVMLPLAGITQVFSKIPGGVTFHLERSGVRIV